MIQRKDIYLLWDITDGNPNGDPGMDNRPRTDHVTEQGIATDACIKRKIRNFFALVLGPDSLYIRERGVLAPLHKKAYDALGLSVGADSVKPARTLMCENYIDVRTFGALMTTGKAEAEAIPEEDGDVAPKEKKGKGTKGKGTEDTGKYDCGAVRGPVQVSMSRSIDPVDVNDLGITRTALTNKDEGSGSHVENGELVANSGTMGNKYTISYGLFQTFLNINPFQAQDTGYSEEDDALLMKALTQLFENDASSARVSAYVRKVYVFTHKEALGNALRHKLFDLIKVEKKTGIESPRQFSDYTITVNTENLPTGVTLEELVDGL